MNKESFYEILAGIANRQERGESPVVNVEALGDWVRENLGMEVVEAEIRDDGVLDVKLRSPMMISVKTTISPDEVSTVTRLVPIRTKLDHVSLSEPIVLDCADFPWSDCCESCHEDAEMRGGGELLELTDDVPSYGRVCCEVLLWVRGFLRIRAIAPGPAPW